MGNVYDPAVSVLSGGFSRIASYSWVLLILVGIISIGAIAWWIKKIKQKKNQWTHTLKVRRVLQDGKLTLPIYHRMRRCPLIKKAEVFELEKPLLGSYLIPELSEYSGENEFSIILDTNNRIYTPTGEYFSPEKSCLNVSARHSEIDIQRQNLRAKFQNINKINKRIEWATITKYAFLIILIIGVTIMSIVALQEWGEAQKYKSQEAQAMASAMDNLATAMETIQATVNTQQLEISQMLKKLHNTNNLNSILNT